MVASAAARRPPDRAVAYWLLACCAMVFVMIVLGGVTRLTHSGLSMVEWKPLTGWLPPMNEAEWQRTFAQYQHYPEFQQLNRDMTLEGFKSIFWLEFIHRVWGRTLGLAFAVPFLYFAFVRGLERPLLLRLLAVFTLGAMQGVLGWYMVMSGLDARPDVSQYRLSAHLGLAFLLYGYMLWLALDLLGVSRAAAAACARAPALAVFALVSVTVLSGGFVAGTDAGFAYNTFPLMGGRLVPEHLFAMQPLPRNFFENIATVQFTHRLLAIATGLAALGLWLAALRRPATGAARVPAHVLAAAVVVQITLGISTLLLAVPVPLAAAHQAGGVMLFSAALWVLHGAWRGR